MSEVAVLGFLSVCLEFLVRIRSKRGIKFPGNLLGLCVYSKVIVDQKIRELCVSTDNFSKKIEILGSTCRISCHKYIINEEA